MRATGSIAVCLLVCLALSATARADVLLHYEFTYSPSPTTSAANMDTAAAKFTQGAANVLNYEWTSSVMQPPIVPPELAIYPQTTTANCTEAMAAGDYVEFTVAPMAGYMVNVASMSGIFGNSGGPQNRWYNIFASKDGGATWTSITGGDYMPASQGDVPTGEQHSYTLTALGYTGGPVTFRIAASCNGGAVWHMIYVDNLDVNGTVAPIPEPATMALLGLGLAGLLLRRKK